MPTDELIKLAQKVEQESYYPDGKLIDGAPYTAFLEGTDLVYAVVTNHEDLKKLKQQIAKRGGGSKLWKSPSLASINKSWCCPRNINSVLQFLHD